MIINNDTIFFNVLINNVNISYWYNFNTEINEIIIIIINRNKIKKDNAEDISIFDNFKKIYLWLILLQLKKS